MALRRNLAHWLSASGKTTLARALVSRLNELGIDNVVLIDGEEFRARLWRPLRTSPQDREAVWRRLVEEASTEMKSGKVVVIAAIAHRASMRVMARNRLSPFFEVYLDCPVAVCSARDTKGNYQRAFASEYDCFIGVTHPYERSNSELQLDTAALSPVEAESLLSERVIQFLATADSQLGITSGYRLTRIASQILQFLDKVPPSFSELPWFRNYLLKQSESRKPVVQLERKDCAQLFVIFGGIDAIMGSRDGKATGSQIEAMRRWGLLRRNLLYIRDPYLENFTHGISAEIPDTESLAGWISSYASSLPHVRELHSVGYSSGSYGALTFGHLCRMQTVWAFSPRTVRLNGSDEAMARLRSLLSEYNGVTRYSIWYSALNKRDREFADWLADCPGVTVHLQNETGDSHSLLMHLASTGRLRTILPSFVPSMAHAAGDLASDEAEASGSA